MLFSELSPERASIDEMEFAGAIRNLNEPDEFRGLHHIMKLAKFGEAPEKSHRF